MKKLAFIKLGGSLITDKTKVNKARLPIIKKISLEIKELLEKNKDLSLLIFTGAGGYGHPVAAKYKNNLEKGLLEIKKAVKEINGIVVSSLKVIGLEAVSVEPDKVAKYDNGEMASLSSSYIISLLKKNIIPVFHADLVTDKFKGVSVLSMDRFLADSAIYFKKKGYKIKRVIFAGTTNGVIDEKGKTIPKINRNNFSQTNKVFFKGKGVDVSGGMRYKVEQCLRLADKGIKADIINGTIVGSLQDRKDKLPATTIL